MSKISRKTSLALALTAAFAFAGSAFAADQVTGPATPQQIANVTVATTGANAGLVNLNPVVFVLNDVTTVTGKQTVTVTLNQGTFATEPGVNDSAGTAATITAGGQGKNFVTFTVTAPTAVGTFFTLGTAAAPLNVAGTSLATLGQSVSATVASTSQLSGAQVINQSGIDLADSANALSFDATAAATGPTVDVGAKQALTVFSPDGSVGNAAPSNSFEAGSLAVTSAGGYTFGTDDTVDVVVTADHGLAAFAQAGGSVSLNTATTCAAATQVAGSVATINATQTTATISGVAPTDANGAYVCFTVPAKNAQIIRATGLAVTASLTSGATGTASPAVKPSNGGLLPIGYNGTVTDVATFNPASNTSMQSFLRISNTTGATVPVIINGTDDAGNTYGPVTATIAGNQSIQLTAADLENGNASKVTGSLGAPAAGKWQLQVITAGAGLNVTNFNRSQASGIISNLGGPLQ